MKAYRDIRHTCIIEGDGKYLSIAAASILAKTYRDDYMENAHLKYPDYRMATGFFCLNHVHIMSPAMILAEQRSPDG